MKEATSIKQGGLFAYFRTWRNVVSGSLLLPRRPALITSHDTSAVDKVQHLIHVKERGALAALHVLDAAAPTRAGGRPLLPKADDEGADRWNWGGFSHTSFLMARPFGFSETQRVSTVTIPSEERRRVAA
jgi:hypothetical protein